MVVLVRRFALEIVLARSDPEEKSPYETESVFITFRSKNRRYANKRAEVVLREYVEKNHEWENVVTTRLFQEIRGKKRHH